MISKLKYLFIGLLLAVALPALAVNVSVPSSPGTNYVLQGLSTGNWAASKNLTVAGTTTLATTTTSNLNETVTVTGFPFAQTEAGVNSALAACNLLHVIGLCGGVYMAPGNYIFHVTNHNIINLYDGVSLTGAGDATSISVAATTTNSFNVFNAPSSISNVTLGGFYLNNDNNMSTTSTSVNTSEYGFYINNGGSNLNFKDIHFQAFEYDINVTNVSYSLFSGLRDFSSHLLGTNLNNTGSFDLIASHNLSTSTITGNNSSVGDTTYRLAGAKNVLVTNNQIRSSSVEISNEGSPASNVTISNNTFSENSTGAIAMADFSDSAVTPISDGYTAAVDGVNITGNTFQLGDNAGLSEPDGILAYTSSILRTDMGHAIANVKIQGNKFYMISPVQTYSSHYGIRAMFVGDTAYHWDISNNTFINMNDGAMNLTSLVKSTEHDNQILNFNRNGYSSSANAAIQVQGNSSSSISYFNSYNDTFDGDKNANTNAYYLGNPSYINNLQIGAYAILAASSTEICLSTCPSLKATTFLGPTLTAGSSTADSFFATNSHATSTFAGHLGIQTTNAAYPLSVVGGVPAFSLLYTASPSSQQIVVGTSSIPAVASAITISAYVKPTVTSSGSVVSIFPDFSFSNFLTLKWNQSNSHVDVMTTNTNTIVGSANNSVPIGSWTLVTYTFDGTTNKIYINGALSSSTVEAYASAAPNFLNFGMVANHNFYQGKLGIVRIWNRALTSTEVSNSYQGYTNTTRSGLVGEWLLQEGSGSTISDTSGNGNTGTFFVTNPLSPAWSADYPPESEMSSIIADFTSPGNVLSSLDVYSNGQIAGGYFTATLSTSTFKGATLSNIPSCNTGNALTTDSSGNVGCGGVSSASSTLFADTNTFSGVNKFTNASSDFAGTWQTFSPSHFDTFSYPFLSSATSSLLSFTGGILSLASSTIGDSTQGGGLTVNGGATTTGTVKIVASGSNTIPALQVGNDSSGVGLDRAAANSLGLIGNSSTIVWNGVAFDPSTDNSKDLGIINTNRWRNLFLSGGALINASSTIGDGSRTGGLTINGGASTTGAVYLGGAGTGFIAPSLVLTVQGIANNVNQGVPGTAGTSQPSLLRLVPSNTGFGETLDIGMNISPSYAWLQSTNNSNLSTKYALSLNPTGGNVGIGTTTPFANLQVTAGNNATTTLEVGQKGSNKGSCIKLYDLTGAAWYYTPAPGTGALTSASASSCASVAGF